MEMNLFYEKNIWLMAMERVLFVFSITLPFDIRDLKVDAHSEVKTIPAVIGLQRTKQLAAVVLFVTFLISLFLFWGNFYSENVLLGLIISYLSTLYFIFKSDKIKHDYFFTGVIDGTMILQFLLIYFASQISF